ncbi:PadR family transcriptional regulator [Methanocaldococcus fervens]|uniref:Transcriptional regulator, PadR-like family n=1 Tax=Methanocaldococcus fervens (strain DSM 4213 / JCM 15782 / AG86) TaxID=573064 RepID=C7P8R4_METFA|nr:PadR family transcriptional regulator [Methanocaldococcus fervens]ACV24946.1 transcriptional regulator, PadR-like family [Methanocaldococcus fervens AG86]
MKHERIRGSLKYLILYLLEKEELHGYAIMQKLNEMFVYYKPSSGVIYPTLQSLRRSGYIEAVKKEDKKLYKITEKGKKYLKENEEKLENIFSHIEAVRGFYELGGKELKDAARLIVKNFHNLNDRQKKEIEKTLKETARKINLIIFGGD